MDAAVAYAPFVIDAKVPWSRRFQFPGEPSADKYDEVPSDEGEQQPRDNESDENRLAPGEETARDRGGRVERDGADGAEAEEKGSEETAPGSTATKRQRAVILQAVERQATEDGNAPVATAASAALNKAAGTADLGDVLFGLGGRRGGNSGGRAGNTGDDGVEDADGGGGDETDAAGEDGGDAGAAAKKRKRRAVVDHDFLNNVKAAAATFVTPPDAPEHKDRSIADDDEKGQRHKRRTATYLRTKLESVTKCNGIYLLNCGKWSSLSCQCLPPPSHHYISHVHCTQTTIQAVASRTRKK